MLRVFACIVIGLFAVLWSSGNDVASFKQKLVHWADGNAEDLAGSGTYSEDWAH